VQFPAFAREGLNPGLKPFFNKLAPPAYWTRLGKTSSTEKPTNQITRIVTANNWAWQGKEQECWIRSRKRHASQAAEYFAGCYRITSYCRRVRPNVGGWDYLATVYSMGTIPFYTGSLIYLVWMVGQWRTLPNIEWSRARVKLQSSLLADEL